MMRILRILTWCLFIGIIPMKINFGFGKILLLYFFVFLTVFVLYHVFRRAAERNRIIGILNCPEWKYGLDICREAKVGRGSVYVHLDALEKEGLVESRVAGETVPRDAIPRREYRLSSEGLCRKRAALPVRDDMYR